MKIVLKAVLNSAGTHACAARISAGDIDKTSDWSFSADDGNKLLGGDDWAAYEKWFMATTSEPKDSKAHYSYPFGKNGKVYRSALIAIRQRSAQQGETGIYSAAGDYLDKIDGKDDGKQMKSVPTMRQRAWAQFEMKALNDEMRVLEGIASTPTPDRMDDIVEPLGAQFELPLPFLWQHDSEQPVGHVVMAKPGKNGIAVSIKLARVDEPGLLRDRLEMAWQSLKHKLVRGLSIGFAPLEYSYLEKTGGYHFIKWAWMELSAVTIPANVEASIAVIKSCDSRVVAARERSIVRLPQRSAWVAGKAKASNPFDIRGQLRRGVGEYVTAAETSADDVADYRNRQ
jgi:HK97 family phage prohead protease